MPEWAIETEDLRKSYRLRWTRQEIEAVAGVSLRVARGVSFGLLGPNGAGKTTFVKMLLSAVHPTSGVARLFGRDSHQVAARRSIGYLPENHRFPTYFTAAGMLDFYAALSGVSARDRARLIPEMLELVGLEDWGNIRLGKFSKGMLQRVGLAQAILHSPSLLILDEPSDGVDPVGRRQIREILRSLEEKGVTIFINSHLLGEVELFCKEVAILRKGQVALTGAVRDLTSGKGYRLSVPDVPEQLQTEIAALATTVGSHNGAVTFHFHDRAVMNGAVDRIRAAGCEIESIVPTTSTLEDVFLQAVEGPVQQ